MEPAVGKDLAIIFQTPFSFSSCEERITYIYTHTLICRGGNICEDSHAHTHVHVWDCICEKLIFLYEDIETNHTEVNVCVEGCMYVYVAVFEGSTNRLDTFFWRFLFVCIEQKHFILCLAFEKTIWYLLRELWFKALLYKRAFVLWVFVYY